ncbi:MULTISPECIES: TetR/AcrR family transcriptional regulator [unclassified Microbacterium]|uniref:TetR/AcrR family transcriptional regulator n=1 Tax=unclassified Microbacterium TaxID=2609290 RepID=UPI0012F85172|nr:TetR family transcriptional regulator [Microbacterium sp. MAH-37]
MKRESSPRTDTREKIIEAAASLIPEVGWGGVSSRRVAERAGVSTGVIHYYVASIEELRRVAAVGRIRLFFLDRINVALTEQDPIDAVETLLRALSQTEPHDPELLLLYESLVAANRDEQLRDEIGASLAELRDRLCDWFAERGIASPRAVAVTLTAAIDGYLLQRSMDPALEPDSLIEGLVGMMRRQAQ